MMELVLRVIGSDNCVRCRAYMSALEKQKIQFVFMDANDKEHRDEFNQWSVHELPVVQIVEKKDDKHSLRFQFQPGPVSSRVVKYRMSEIIKRDTRLNAKNKNIRT